MYTYTKFYFIFQGSTRSGQEREKTSVCDRLQEQKAQAEAATAAKVVEDKEETKRKHAQHILEIKQSMVTMAKKYAKKKKTKKRKHDTSSEDSSSDLDSDASGEVSLSSHSDKKRKKKEKRHRRSPTPRSQTPPLTVTKRKATSPPHALTRTGSDHSELHGDSDAYDSGSDGGGGGGGVAAVLTVRHTGGAAI